MMVKRSEENEIMKLAVGNLLMGCQELSCRWSLTTVNRQLMRLTGDRGDRGRRALPGGAVA